MISSKDLFHLEREREAADRYYGSKERMEAVQVAHGQFIKEQQPEKKEVKMKAS